VLKSNLKKCIFTNKMWVLFIYVFSCNSKGNLSILFLFFTSARATLQPEGMWVDVRVGLGKQTLSHMHCKTGLFLLLRYLIWSVKKSSVGNR
jgi:formate/nitrite transporter FocA (FNT family)